MRSLLFLGLLALAWASSIKLPRYKTPEPQYNTEDSQFKYKTVLQLFQHIYQPLYFPEYEKIGLSYSFEENVKGYSNPKYVSEFFKYYPSDSLPKGQVFSIFYDQHQKEAIAFFKLLYSAVDFDTFYKTAVWGRMFLNEGLYIYSLSVALVHRPDTWYMELPPIYELYPYYFYGFNVFKEAHEKTGFQFGRYQYLKPSGSFPYEYQQKSYMYPYYFGQYLQNTPYKQYPYEYQHQYYGYPYSRTPNMQSYGPYSNDYYQKYQQYPYYGKTSEYKPMSYTPYSEEYYQKQGEYQYPYQQFSTEKMPEYKPYTYGPYSEGYYQKYGQYLQKYQYPYGKYPYYSEETPSPEYKYGKFPSYYLSKYMQQYPQYSQEYYQKSYPWLNEQPTEYKQDYPYSQEYYQKYGQYPWYFKYEKSYPYSQQYYQKSGQYPWYSKYEQSYPWQYEKSMEDTPYSPYSQEYYQKYGQYPWYFKYEKSYPYSQQYYQKSGQYPWYSKYEKSYPWQYEKSMEDTPYSPYSQEYYQKYGQYPGYFKYEKSYPYSQQYYQKSGQYPWYSKYEKSYPWQYEKSMEDTPYSPYSQEYYQKYGQYPGYFKYEKSFPYGQKYYQKSGQYPWYFKYEKSYPWQYQGSMGDTPYSPYSQEYYQKYGQYPEYFRYEKSFPLQYEKSMGYYPGQGSEEYYQKLEKLPWLPYQKYQKYPQYSGEYTPQTEYRPYSPEKYETSYQKLPSFFSKYDKWTPSKYWGQEYPLLQKTFYKSTPYSEMYFQKSLQGKFYEKYETPEYIYGKYPYQYESYQKPQYSPKSEVPQFYQQEREKIPVEYYQQGIVIDANFSTYYSRYMNPEYQMSYFTQDIGLNAFYYYYHIYFPFWLKNEEIIFKTQYRGEQFYYIYQQLMARYNLERVSNGLGEVPILEYELPVGFHTDMMYPNGLPFPERPDHASIRNRYQGSPAYYDNDTMSLMNIKLYEKRLLDAIDSGFVLTRDGKYYSIFEPQGFEILGNLIQANPESPNVRYYGPILVFARYLLGYSNYPLDQYYIAPSVMEQFETSLHDPVFYQLYKKIIYYFQRYKQYLPMYTADELFWKDVKIQDVKVDKLATYFDYFYSDISNIMFSKDKMEELPISVKQYRLNHKPFNYYLNVLSEKPQEAVVRVFLGPKYDVYGKPIDINKNRLNFVELDKFDYSLVPGLNTIERNSREFYGYVPDRTTYKELFLQLVNYQKPLEYTPIQWGWPQRLLLPKGTKEGQVYQMYFLVTPYQPIEKLTLSKYFENKPSLYWDQTYDGLPYGYPFDRPIDEGVFYVPNSYFKDVSIYNEFFPEYTGEYPNMSYY